MRFGTPRRDRVDRAGGQARQHHNRPAVVRAEVVIDRMDDTVAITLDVP
jgi:hypothetical protein